MKLNTSRVRKQLGLPNGTTVRDVQAELNKRVSQAGKSRTDHPRSEPVDNETEYPHGWLNASERGRLDAATRQPIRGSGD